MIGLESSPYVPLPVFLDFLRCACWEQHCGPTGGYISPQWLCMFVHMLNCVFVCTPPVSVHDFIRVCVRASRSLLQPLHCEGSVEQDPNPLVGTNEVHSWGLNGQLTIREPL